ncbi:hypothetical protein HanIR_Chr13g0622781 [Helianthus annuus]|nr:hypothetical protein HanIR_Chr13g0622781 [Helianthus annuus]
MSKDSCCLGPQLNLLFLRVRKVRGAAILEKFSIKRLYYPANPKKLRISVGVFGSCQFMTASTLAGSTWIPRSLTTCPRNWTSRSQNSHLENLA